MKIPIRSENVFQNDSDRPFVTCRLFGQMGNQLYQIATTLAYSWDYDAIALFPALHQQMDRISYNRDRIFFRLDASMPPRSLRAVFEEESFYSSKKIPFQPDQLLVGYFQCWNHFHHHRERILQVFAPSATVETYLQSKYQSLLDRTDTVGVHVRTWVKSNHLSKIHPFIGFDYYREALELFPKDATFVIFSDRINWCKVHFPKQFDRKFVFIDSNDGVEDFFLMTKMRNLIACNSTYSLWGAYLNQNPEKLIISPKYCPHYYPEFPFHDYFLPEWKLLPVTIDHPYPEDMEWYDACTQSVNG